MRNARIVYLLTALVLTTVSPRASWGDSVDGFTEPFRKIELAPAEPGTLDYLSVKEGDTVQKGQLLGALECDILHVSLEIAEAARQFKGRLDSAVAEQGLRENRLAKLEALRLRGHASQEEVDRARTDLAVAEATVRTAKEQHVVDELEAKKIGAMIERRMLRSPLDGIVTAVHKEEREFVSTSAPTVLTLVQLDPLRVTFNVPTGYATALHVGQSLPLSFLDSERNVVGKVEFVSPITEAESGTVRVKVLLDNSQGTYRCGVRCSLALDAKLLGGRTASSK
jgi:RND family efflux transporter MFP subunit